MSTDFGNVKRCVQLQLYQSFKIHLRCAQLLFVAPCSFEQERSSVTYFKQARFLVTAGILVWITMCGYQTIVKFFELPMPFFTAVLYVNEAVLCLFITIHTMSRGYSETQRYKQYFETMFIVASALPCAEWVAILAYARRKLLWLCTALISIYSVVLCFDYLHFGSILATLFSLGAYLLPNILASIALAQYYLGTVLIYMMQQKINQQLKAGKCSSLNLEEAKHLYLHLDRCVELITRSFEVTIVTNVFAGINVTSLQVLEIYQHLHVGEWKPIYMAYNMFWIVMQICMLLMVLYPNEIIKREQTHFGMILFELSNQNDAELSEVQVWLKCKCCKNALTLSLLNFPLTSYQMARLELLTLDRKKSIFVALMSFMIILIQFDEANLNKYKGAVTAIDSLYNANTMRR
ncbi:putative gustatory receptor 59f [Anopheles marshallii]|uniref:putative gustatory receptor 59f n=1 Tax=Anopheles marshallii TaxID=1521116 RepID=UPI00237BE71F|nr:putative gustatory receptor 59f [Anopheles marshallii]